MSDGTHDLERFIRFVRRYYALIILASLALGAVAFAVAKTQHKEYTANLSLNFNNSGLSQELAGIQVVGNADPQATQDTNVALVRLGNVAELTSAAIGGKLTPKQIRAALAVAPNSDTSIVTVSATAPRPALAAEIANTYGRIFVQEQQQRSQQYVNSALNVVQRQLAALAPSQQTSAQAVELQNRAQSLQLLAETQSQSVSVVQQAAVPTVPSSPRVLRTTFFGLAVGLLLGVGLALLRDQLDRRIKTPEALETVYKHPLLGTIPEDSGYGARLTAGSGVPRLAITHRIEPFRLIRAQLRSFNVDKELRTLMVASASPGDGKTLTATNLSAAAALAGDRALLIECDLRRPTIAERLGLAPGPGLASLLVGACLQSEAIQSVALDYGHNEDPSSERVLDVIVAGATPVNPGELIESLAFRHLLADLRSDYEFIVVDTAPLGAVSDAFPLLAQVDGIVVVSRLWRNRTDVAQRVRDTLESANAPVLGVVANGLKQHHSPGYRGYKYGYAYTGSFSPNGKRPTAGVGHPGKEADF